MTNNNDNNTIWSTHSSNLYEIQLDQDIISNIPIVNILIISDKFEYKILFC